VKTLALCLTLLTLTLISPAQRRQPYRELREPKPVLQLPDPPKPAKIDTAKLQRNAQELAELAASVQPDIDQVRRGILPKEVVDKLKRIEKLSKHMRQELTQ
jgi:hypothetical protein